MIMFDKGFSVKNCFVVFSCIFSFSLQMQAQEDVYARLDVLTRMATLCRSATGKAAVSHSDEVMQELKAALDSLDTYRVTGTLESCILTDMIRCGIQRKDTLLVLQNLLDFRNRIYRLLQKEIVSSFYYGWGELKPATNSWLGESYLAMYLYRYCALNVALYYPNEVTAQLGYEILLHSKNLKLKADNHFKFMARESGHVQVQEWCRKLYLMQQEYIQKDRYIKSLPLYEQLKVYDRKEMDILKQLKGSIEQLRDSMMTEANKDYSYLNRFVCPWFTVRKSLLPDELAIEFAEIPMLVPDDSVPKDRTHYVAFAITAALSVPQVVFVCSSDQFKNLDVQTEEGLKQLYTLIWYPLKHLLKDKKRIYFSPDGEIHHLPVEAAFRLVDITSDREVFRLSSDYQLVNRPKRTNIRNMVAYGGLDYEGGEYEESRTTSQTVHKLLRGFSKGLETRGTRDYLKWSLDEVNEIENIVRKHSSVTFTKFIGKRGTEESFYDLSERNVDLLHVSTHGFYYTPEDIENLNASRNRCSFWNQGGDSGDSDEDMLVSSGLVLSGANQVLRTLSAPKGREDGILTAWEIAAMDLSSCDLVVLSACQTGLGNISPEGIYGLQRGFKKAGVGALLMSLWDVDDEATALLMKRFYKLLFQGKSNQEALREAQRYVAGRSAEYQHPYYWAGWILLDGLN